MKMFYQKLIDTALIKAISGNPAMAFLVFGALIFFASTQRIVIFDVNISPYLTDLGRTTVIAGVFSVILKSAQFTAVFREIIMAAIYNPAHIDDEALLLKNWRLVSDAIFLKILPLRYPRPTTMLGACYIDNNADYHFTEFQIHYDIEVGENGCSIVTNILKADIFLAPDRKQPVFSQTIEGDGSTGYSGCASTRSAFTAPTSRCWPTIHVRAGSRLNCAIKSIPIRAEPAWNAHSRPSRMSIASRLSVPR